MAKPTTKKATEQLSKKSWSQFNGLSDSLWSGIKGSFYKFIGLDPYSQPGSLRVEQKLAKDSGTTITDKCNVGLTLSDGSRLWFSYTSGKIWRDVGGTYTLVYTTVPTSGSAGCLGAREFNGKVYWATQNYLHYTSDYTFGTVAGLNWQLLAVTDANWHPMEVANASLFVGDGHQIHSVSSANVYTANVLDLIAPNKIKCMKAYDIDLVIGTYIDSTVNHCWVVRWDTIQTTWQFMEPVAENGINSLFWSGQTLLAQAGQYGMIYYYNGKNLIPYKRIPGTWTPTSNGEILPNAADIFNNFAVFGFTADAGNPTDQAVYKLGAYLPGYTASLSESYPISSGNFSNINIGVVLGSGQNLYVAWQDTGAGTQGVDKLDWSNLYASAYLETMEVHINEDPDSIYEEVKKMYAFYQSMPVLTALTFKYYADNGSLTTPTNTIENESTHQQYYVDEAIQTRSIRMRIEFTVSGNNGPVLEEIGLVKSQ